MRPELEAVLEAYRQDAAIEEQLIQEILTVLAVTGAARKRTIQELSQVVNRHTMKAAEDRDYRQGTDDLARFDFHQPLRQM
ncbi:hypothetical protein [Hyphomicrobium sp.]|jgi:hypothetical protein|uniref:hypothetical protein n=1 Tax=Hyphomicrobium sp. TaxID=82 RepID=UPI00356A800B